MAAEPGWGRKVVQTIGAVRTGIIILIITGIVSAAGTVVLQRPLTDPEDLQRAYSPATLRVLDAIGMTDVYHAWWYAALLALLAISIIFASIERWPSVWRYYSRPYRRTEPGFRATLPQQKSFPITDPAAALAAAERALRQHGMKTERIIEHGEVSLFAEKSRYAVMAVYVVHFSLLLIMLGGIVDSIVGYKGYVQLVPGQPAVRQIQLRDNSMHRLPFELRCDGAGQENYTGQFAMMPKRWWSKLVVLENGREVERKEIAVNEPLVRDGIRFYQSGYGQSAVLKQVRVAVVNGEEPSNPATFRLSESESGALPDGRTVRLVRFLPDAYQMDGGIYQRSRELGAAALEVEIGTGAQAQRAWLFRTDQAGPEDVALVGPLDAQGELVKGLPRLVARVETLPFTGLQVSYEPGQWAVWAGCLLMAVGLVMAFWVLHQRYWAAALTNAEGKLVLWFGGACNKNREAFVARFTEVAATVEKELQAETDRAVPAATRGQ
jgi:cytochrome c biogenesis protein